jgi:hypothetical protein
MKKLLLSVLLASGFFASAQVLQTETFNALPNGNVGTDITGATAGQDGWFTFASNGAAPTTSTNAGNDNFIIVDNGYEGNGIGMTGPNGTKGSRVMWKGGFDALWAGRDGGNEIIEVEYDFFTGGIASTAQSGVRIYGTDDSVTPAVDRVLNGFVYSSNTGVLQGVCYLLNGTTYGTYLIGLGPNSTTPLTLSPDTWYRLGLAYDTTTGECIWKVSDYTDTLAWIGTPDTYWAGPFAPNEIDMIMAIPAASGTIPANTAATSIAFDTMQVEATFEEALLGTNSFQEKLNFSVYPNPASSVINVSTPAEASISQIVMTDINGRTVKTVKVEGINAAQVSISDLATGVYTLKVVSDKGTAVKKVIKN